MHVSMHCPIPDVSKVATGSVIYARLIPPTLFSTVVSVSSENTPLNLSLLALQRLSLHTTTVLLVYLPGIVNGSYLYNVAMCTHQILQLIMINVCIQ